MINLEKIKCEKCQTPHPFKKTCPCTILPPPFFNFSDSPLWGRYLKFTPPPFKKGASDYVNSAQFLQSLWMIGPEKLSRTHTLKTKQKNN